MQCTREALLNILALSEQSAALKSLIENLIVYLKQWFGCQAVGVRLRDRDDYTYFDTTDLSADFVRAENSLRMYDEQGKLLRDKDGNPLLDCMCGYVINGHIDASKSYFTEHGSFWTNSISELSKQHAHEEHHLPNVRGRCASEFESLALIPLRMGDSCLGLLQFGDKRKGVFSLEQIKLLEETAIIIAHSIDKMQTHEQLQSSQHMMDNASHPIYKVEPGGKIIYANDAVARLTGYTREELLTMYVSDLNPNYPPDKWQSYWPELKRRRSITLETSHRTKDGTEIPVEMSTCYVEIDGREMSYAFERDISKCKKAQNKAAEVSNDFETFFNLVPDLVCIASMDGYFKRLNSAWEDALGYTLDELLSQPLMRFVHPDDVDRTRKAVEEQIAGKPITNFVNRYRCKDGSIKWLEWQTTPAKNGKLLYAAARDITERIKAEEAKRAGHERLVALSRQLVSVQEAQRRKMARELHDEIGGAITALSIALGMATSLGGNDAKESLKHARDISGELARHVRELALDLRPAALDDLGLVPALLKLFDRYSARTQVQVHFRHKDAQQRFPAEIETAGFRIIQEALNNVARHANVTEAWIELWATENELHVMIEDSGAGFDPKSALETCATIGLSSMSERASLLGGTFAIDSSPGAGTHISVSLPIESGPK